MSSCPVCFEKLAEQLTPCGHAFCHGCLIRWQAESNTCPLCRACLVRPIESFSHSTSVQALWFDSPLLRLRAKAGIALGMRTKVELRGPEILFHVGRACILRKQCEQVAFMTNNQSLRTEVSVRHNTSMLAISWRFDPKLAAKVEEWFASAANAFV